MTEFVAVKEFNKDLKKIQKKYRSLKNDFKTFKKALRAELDSLSHLPGTVRVSDLGENVSTPIYKVRRFRCQSLGGGSRSGIRVVYAHEEEKNRVIFVEIYYKGKKAKMDKKRVLKYFQEE